MGSLSCNRHDVHISTVSKDSFEFEHKISKQDNRSFRLQYQVTMCSTAQGGSAVPRPSVGPDIASQRPAPASQKEVENDSRLIPTYSVFKLKRTDTTLDLSQKAKRGEEPFWGGGSGDYIDVGVAVRANGGVRRRRS
ncbi:hypothetical protein G7K_4761-t1 [Saitoella complicata NRRL Y-17804]|uniref:Uncharacterized protein n=1 Tax=Saitoella complicata (strain BCRC 22490 / CBS 7301 / JCM 7358 / NBRC 10748 / NRRL Y-17804) TaxID=698492 RepID=A0A0E9NLG3_SAICN|nr:hypothetical protein G7K_4761-t1 [Saitoella complicata NRRL Y-17804]